MKRTSTVLIILFTAAVMYFVIGFGFANESTDSELYHQITVEEAEQLVENRNTHLEENSLIQIDGEKFKMREVLLLTELNGAEYLFVERAAHEDGTECSVLWAMTADNKKIGAMILERAWPCPPNCFDQVVMTN